MDLRDSNPLLLGCIAKEGKKIYGGKNIFFQEIIGAQKQYLDFEPYFKLEEKTVRAQIKNLKTLAHAQ